MKQATWKLEEISNDLIEVIGTYEERRKEREELFEERVAENSQHWLKTSTLERELGEDWVWMGLRTFFQTEGLGMPIWGYHNLSRSHKPQ